jgi:hypothetical protein
MNHTKKTARAFVAVAVGWVAVLGLAHAQETGKVMIDVADCIKLEAPEARLSCYESRVAAVFGERAAQAAAVRPVAPAPAAAAAIRTPEPAPVATPAPAAPSPPTATSTTAPRTVSVAAAPPGTEPVQSRADRQSRREDSDKAAAEVAANDIVSLVKELHETVPNAWQITLENGQVWRQTVSKHYELRPGAQVRIYGTRWGSASRLTAETINGYIQVERVR